MWISYELEGVGSNMLLNVRTLCSCQAPLPLSRRLVQLPQSRWLVQLNFGLSPNDWPSYSWPMNYKRSWYIHLFNSLLLASKELLHVWVVQRKESHLSNNWWSSKQGQEHSRDVCKHLIVYEIPWSIYTAFEQPCVAQGSGTQQLARSCWPKGLLHSEPIRLMVYLSAVFSADLKRNRLLLRSHNTGKE